MPSISKLMNIVVSQLGVPTAQAAAVVEERGTASAKPYRAVIHAEKVFEKVKTTSVLSV